MNNEHPYMRVLRYMVPNSITLSSMVFGLMSLYSSHTHNFSLAAWLVIYAVLTDRLDGIVARMMKATSEMGMQLDSFADMLNFGIAPAYMMLLYIPTKDEFYRSGTGQVLLVIACSFWMLCAVFRLARYNVMSDDAVPTKIFYGWPTTLAGGLLMIWTLLLMKYDAKDGGFGGAKLFGESLTTPKAVWTYTPIVIALFGYLMASRIPMPKFLKSTNKVIRALLLAGLILGYVCGFTMHYPEAIFWMPTLWVVSFLIWGQVSKEAKALVVPALFPKKNEDEVVVRPQEDLPAEDIMLEDPRPTTSS